MRDRNARLFVAISLASGFGSAAMMLAAPVWTLDLTGSSSLAALCGLFLYAPTLLAPAVGVVVDRLPRVPTVVCANVAMAALLMTLFAVRSQAQLWLLFTAMFGYGLTYVTRDAAETALLPAALPTESLGHVNGLRMSAREGMKLIAPLAGAGIYAWAGGRAVATMASAMLLATAWLYGRLRLRGQPAAATVKRTPVRFLFAHQHLRSLTITTALAVAMSGLTTAALYTVIVTDLRLAPAFAGVLASAQGAGSIAGGIVAGRLIRRWGTAPAVGVGALLFAMGPLAQCVPLVPIVIAGSIAIGVGLPWTVVATETAVQRDTPNEMLGGVGATATMAIFAPLVVAIPAGAALVELIDHRLVLILATLIALSASVLVVPWRVGKKPPATQAGTLSAASPGSE